MNKTIRERVCNRLSPNRFSVLKRDTLVKTAGINQLLSGLGNKIKSGWNSYSKYLDTLSRFEPVNTSSGGFLKDLWNGATAYLNPKNYVNAIKYGPHMFVKNLRDTTFNADAWRTNPVGNALTSAFNVWGPYATLSILFDNSAYNDTEGAVQKTTRNAMNIADAIDLSSKIMNHGTFGIPSIIGNIATRGFIAPMVAKKIDDTIGTSASGEQLRTRLVNRIKSETQEKMNQNPGMTLQEAQEELFKSILQEYGPDAAQKIFS